MNRENKNIIALVDPFLGGHHLSWLVLFAKELLSLDKEVWIFSSDPHTVRMAINDSGIGEEVGLEIFEVRESKPVRIFNSKFFNLLQEVSSLRLMRWIAIGQSIKNTSVKNGRVPGLVFFMWLDSYLSIFLNHFVIDMLFPFVWSGIYFHPRHLRPRTKGILDYKHFISPDNILKSPKRRYVGILDEGVEEKLKSELCKDTVIVFPDIADDSAPDVNFDLARQVKERGKITIGLFGNLEKRKGVLTLLEAAHLMKSDQRYLFVFAGDLRKETFSADELVMINSARKNGNCLFYLKPIPTEAQFNGLISLCDVIFAAYEHFPHSSNILTKATLFDKPIIVSDGFCMAERVRKYHTGVVVSEGDAGACVMAIRSLSVMNNDQRADMLKNFEIYRNIHSQPVLHTILSKITS